MVSVRKINIEEIETARHLVEEYSSYAIEGLPHPDVQWQRYKHLEAAGLITVLGAFQDGILVGFATVLENVSLHYGLQMSIAESFFVSRDHRSGGAGTKLRLAMQQHSKDVGSVGLMLTAPFDKELDEVLPKAGYVQTHNVYYWSAND